MLKNVIKTPTSISYSITINIFHLHHQPINVPTAGVQAFLMDYNKEIGP
jgi:hypothetical protein